LLVQALLAGGAASAADIQTQPIIDVRAEQNDNFRMAPGGDPDADVYGVIADAQLLMDIATPRGTATLRPRIRYQNYPDRDDLEKFEGFLDLSAGYRWERSSLELIGHLSHEDLYNNETAGGDFDPTDPDGGGGSDTGDIDTSQVRDEFEIRPTWEHRLTERTSLGLGADYSIVRYDADPGVETKKDYDYIQGDAYLKWAIDPRSDVSAGAYVSHYEAVSEDDETIDAVGIQVGYDYRWSEQIGFQGRLFYEENDIEETIPFEFSETTSNFGGYVSAYYRQQVSRWQMSVGRSFNPTGDGGKSEIDQFRLVYERDLSPRLSFKGAGRYETRNGLGSTSNTVDRDFARLDLSLRWLASRNWYIGGGYAYMWQDRATAADSGDNNKFYINFGYQGLRQDTAAGRL
jgi:hypothetical protein